LEKRYERASARLEVEGFTMLAVVDASMNRPKESQASLGVFDDEIRAVKKESPEGAKQTLKT
jgi:hypothetical protein